MQFAQVTRLNARFAMLVLYCLCSTTGYAYVEKVTARARDLGVPFDGAPGDLNAIDRADERAHVGGERAGPGQPVSLHGVL